MIEFHDSIGNHIAFVAFVAVAVYAQNITGFALALILLGLVSITNVVELTDAIDAVTIIIIVNAATFLWKRYPVKLERKLWPSAAASLVGTALGVVLIELLIGAVYEVVRLLLGVSIVASAILLWRSANPLKRTSSAVSFTLTGWLSGLLGGLFSAPGPPLVYLMYRQPWPQTKIQESLILFFGVGAALRLIVVILMGEFSSMAFLLAIESIPIVFLVTAFSARCALPFSPAILKLSVCALLVASGASTIGASLVAMG